MPPPRQSPTTHFVSFGHVARIGLLAVALTTAGSFAACKGETSSAPPEPVPTGPVGPAVATPSGAQRLTVSQYTASIHDVFGAEVVVPTALEPDVALDGFESIGATSSTVSARGIEQYESAAYAIGKQIGGDPKLLARVLPCKPQAADDAACARAFVTTVGPRVFRRPLTEPEIAKVASKITTSGVALGSFEKGLAYGVAALLQSPQFLYRAAVGEPDPERPGQKRYTGYELATRLSFFLWNSTPDDALLEAAKAGKLGTYEGVASEVDRMLASPKAREGLRNFVREWLRLGDLDLLQKDSKLFTTFSTELGAMAREETLKVFEDIVFDKDTDVRDVMTTRHTFVTPKLASMYEVPAPSATGFAPIDLPAGRRRGLLGHVSILALYAHPTSSSATLRGKFVREKLLCVTIPPPPANLNTALPEPTESAKTLRDRVQIHFTVPSCAACHLEMDPIGLGLEQFDGIGRGRTKENGVVIDASGKLDGVPFTGPDSLGQAIHDHRGFPTCIVRKVFQYATGVAPDGSQVDTLDAMNARFIATGYRMKTLLGAVATSPAFRSFGAPH